MSKLFILSFLSSYLLNMIIEDNHSYMLPVCWQKPAVLWLFADLYSLVMLLCILGQIMSEWMKEWKTVDLMLTSAARAIFRPDRQAGSSGRAGHLKLLRRFTLFFFFHSVRQKLRVTFICTHCSHFTALLIPTVASLTPVWQIPFSFCQYEPKWICAAPNHKHHYQQEIVKR